MNDLERQQKQRALGRRGFLKLTGGAVSLGALAYSAGWLSHSPLPEPHQEYPAYIDDETGVPVFRGPYLQQAQMAAFLLGADFDRLSALCDRYLNIPAQGVLRYIPLMSGVVMIYADMFVASQDQRDRLVGRLPETELSFWILTIALRKAGPIYLPHHLAWFLPYLFVDDSSAIATGREVYGFNKQMAQFEKTTNIRQPEFSADVTGFKRFQDTDGKRERLLTMHSTGSASAGKTWSSWGEAQMAIEQTLMSQVKAQNTAPLFEAATRLAVERAPLVFLKQFRDAAHTELACYQAVIEAPIKVDRFIEGGYLNGSYSFQLNPLASHPLSQRLGLHLQNDVQPVTAGAWLKVDFTLETGVEVWRVK